MIGVKTFGQRTDDFVIGSAFLGRIDDLWAQGDVLMPACLVEVIMFKEHGRRQDNIRHLRSFGHELLMNTDKKILPGETLMYSVEIWRHRHRVGVLNQQRRYPGAVSEILSISRQDRSDAGLIEHSYLWIAIIQAFYQRFVPMIDIAVIVKGASALVAPTAGNGRNRKRRMHIGRAISLTGKAITQAEEGLRRTADH